MKNEEIRIDFNIDLPQDIELINSIFKNNNYSLYVVGGSVRDSLLNEKIKDFDLATDAIPDEVEKILNSVYKTLPIGKAFGVINALTSTGDFEIATFRSDGNYSDSRRPDSVEFTSIDQDASRRDLTINALYYDIDKKQIIDFFGGVDDLKNNIIRTVGNASERFEEDRLRMLRSIRFAGRFESELHLDIHAVLINDNNLSGVSSERIRDEFLKGIISSKNTSYFLKLIDKYGMFDYIFPNLNVNKDFVNSKEIPVVIAELLKNNDIGLLKEELNKLTYNRDEISQVSFLLNFLSLNTDNAFSLKKMQANSKLNNEQIQEFAKINNIETNLIDAFIKFKPSISGNEVMNNGFIGIEVGKEINRIETELFKKIIS